MHCDYEDVTVEDSALVYVAGFVCKRVLRDHDCLLCRQALLKDTPEFLDSAYDTFMRYKLYTHCTPSSLHRPSDNMVAIVTLCRNVFVEEFDVLQFNCGVLHQLVVKCLEKLRSCTLLSTSVDLCSAESCFSVSLYCVIPQDKSY